MKTKFLVVTVAILTVASLTACSSLQGSVTENIDDRHVEYSLVKHDGGTVVFENGLGGRIEGWAKVFPEVAREASAFVYNRPGYGNSDPISSPRDGTHVVDELRLLLKRKGLNPPYVLVGHSVGGLYMQLFARRYPEETSALILVDSTHPAQFKGKGSPQNWPIWFRMLFGLATSAVEKEEFDAIDATGETVLSLPPFTGKPVIVLSALEPMKAKSELADDANEKRQDFIRLYPGAKQIWVDSGHVIPLEKPEIVISTIREVLQQK